MTDSTYRTPSRDAVRRLASEADGARVSIYLAAPAASGAGFADLRSFPTRWRGLVEQAVRRLRELGDEERAEEAQRRLEGLDVEPRAVPAGSRGLAVFDGPDGLHAFALRGEVDERVSVGRSFALRPLLREMHANRTYRVLALSPKRVALFEGDASGLREVDRGDVPATLEHALGPEFEARDDVQLHSTARGGLAPAYHGQGGAREERHVDLDRFHHVVGRTVRARWSDRNEPLVLAADDAHQGRFRKVVDLPGLVAEGVHGSPDRLGPDELHARAWPLVERQLDELDRSAAGTLRDAIGHGKGIERLEEVVRATLQNRVRTVWLDAERKVPKHIDASTGALEPARGDEDALDELAALVLRRGGDAVVADGNGGMPSDSGVAAELRG